MREEDGCSWEEIHAALPHRTLGAIQVPYSTKLRVVLPRNLKLRMCSPRWPRESATSRG
jgi:hypothetical protein